MRKLDRSKIPPSRQRESNPYITAAAAAVYTLHTRLRTNTHTHTGTLAVYNWCIEYNLLNYILIKIYHFFCVSSVCFCAKTLVYCRIVIIGNPCLPKNPKTHNISYGFENVINTKTYTLHTVPSTKKKSLLIIWMVRWVRCWLAYRIAVNSRNAHKYYSRILCWCTRSAASSANNMTLKLSASRVFESVIAFGFYCVFGVRSRV